MEEVLNSLKVTFNKPADKWTDAVPIGNGRLGAMIWGGVASDLIQLNEDTLWTGTPGKYANPEVPKALSQVRKLVDDGQYLEADQASSGLFGDPSNVYQLLGDIKVDFGDSHQTYSQETYHRELDLETATARVTYTAADAEFTREYFASCPDQAFVTKICSSKPGTVSFTVSLDSKMSYSASVLSQTRILLEGSCPEKRIPPPQALNAADPAGIKFAAVLEIRASEGCRISVCETNKLQVVGSDWAVLILVAASSFQGPFVNPADSTRDPKAECLDSLKPIEGLSYSDLYARHLDDYQKLFNRVSLKLGKSFIPDVVPTVERIRSFQSDEDPSLLVLLFQFGRYLLISSSRPGTQVANLQGIWNACVTPPWDSACTLNINQEMNYWPALPCNLEECQEPLFELLKSLSQNGSRTAKVNYGADGWVAHHTTDIWAKSSAAIGRPVWAVWPMGGAWLCTHLWEHYMFTLDKDFLEHTAYPLLEGCASFLLSWLIDGPDGHLETNPSTSPEHSFVGPDGKEASVSFSSTMDMAIIKEIFLTVLSASEILGRDDDTLVQRVRETIPRLLPPRVAASDGSLMEWALDFKDAEVDNRHISHLFGIFPGHTITTENNPDLCKAAEKSLNKRGVAGPGWSTTWKTAVWARLKNVDNAYMMVKHLITLVPEDETKEGFFEGGLYSNLFTAHPPFQIDANFGFSAAITEMLLQNTMTDLYLLPALPRDKWPSGSVEGLRARGGLTVGMSWEEGELQEAVVTLKDGCSEHNLHYNGISVTFQLKSGIVYKFNGQLKCQEETS